MGILDTTISRTVARGIAVDGYRVTMQRGGVYFVTAGDGNIIRTDMAFEPSGQWRAVAVYTSRGSRLCDWDTFASAYAGTDKPMAFKNGKPLYFIGDFDHGSHRVQGEGIARIQRAKFSRGMDGRWVLA